MTSSQRSYIRNTVKSALASTLAALVGKLLAVEDVCARLGCCERTFYRRRRRWNFPTPLINEGKFIRWSPSQLTTWELSKNVHTTAKKIRSKTARR